MRHPTLLATLIFIATSASAFAAESQFERELKQLTEQRDKAAAAAVEPINKRYQVSLEQLLKRATQANALDDAIKIREALGALSAPIPSVAATISKTKAKNIEHKLDGTNWVGDGKMMFNELTFFKGGSLRYGKTGTALAGIAKYEVGEDGTIHFAFAKGEAQQISISADSKTLTWNESTFTRK